MAKRKKRLSEADRRHATRDITAASVDALLARPTTRRQYLEPLLNRWSGMGERGRVHVSACDPSKTCEVALSLDLNHRDYLSLHLPEQTVFVCERQFPITCVPHLRFPPEEIFGGLAVGMVLLLLNDRGATLRLSDGWARVIPSASTTTRT